MKWSRLFKSFKDAWRGLTTAFKSEQNFRIQIMVSLVVAGLALYFPLRVWEAILIILLVGWVLTMELLNTAFEYFIDLLKPRLHHYVYAIKDIMAAAVLVSSLVSVAIGFIIFFPHFLNLFK